MKKILIAFAALAAFGAAEVTFAQATNAKDDTELLISQIQTDKRAIVLAAMQLTDAEVRELLAAAGHSAAGNAMES